MQSLPAQSHQTIAWLVRLELAEGGRLQRLAIAAKSAQSHQTIVWLMQQYQAVQLLALGEQVG